MTNVLLKHALRPGLAVSMRRLAAYHMFSVAVRRVLNSLCRDAYFGGLSMNPLIAIAAALFPEILKAVAGDGGGRIAATVTKAVTDVAGTTDPVEAERKVTQDPRRPPNSEQSWRGLRLRKRKCGLRASKIRETSLSPS